MLTTVRARRRLLTWLSAGIMGMIVGYIYVNIAYKPLNKEIAMPWSGARAGLFIALASAGFEMYLLDARSCGWIRRLPFLVMLASRLVVHTLLITVVLYINILIGRAFAERWTTDALSADALGQDIAFSFFAIAVLLFVYQMRNLIGGRALRNFVLGRYYRPVEENRVFILVDLVGSSSVAGTLGNARFHEFLSRFFFDIDAPIAEHGGEVYSYVGDAVIASWPAGDARNRQAALFALRDILVKVDKVGAAYVAGFGLAPKARAALHAGPVVAGECGDTRRQIMYLGDTLNAVSRIEGIAKERRCTALASTAMLDGIDVPAGLTAVAIGAWPLAGFAKPLNLVALDLATAIPPNGIAAPTGDRAAMPAGSQPAR